MSDIGKSISECISFLSKVGAECELLAPMLRQALNNLLSDELAKKFAVAGPWQEVSLSESSGWICTDSAHSLPLIIKPKRTVGGYLSFQISLGGTGIAAVGNDQPLLHIGFWTKPVDFEERWMGFPLDESALTLEQGRLFRWPTPQENLSEWVYCVRLAEVNTMQDVQEKVVAPVKFLLLSERASDSHPLCVPGVVRFCEVEGEPGQYRVVQ
ncbi:hypothetical protein [Pseudomonas boanensis]|uniref:hypothetical protein n=1 Tax=Metapseudomonas boanensis TaxID=2822138 RepID=UPI0035D4DB21